MTLSEIKSTVDKNLVWGKFRAHHYSPDDWNPGAWVFLAKEIFDGKELVVGMSAALRFSHPRVLNTWRSYKVVALPLTLPDFDRTQMWREIADAQAARFINDGYHYFCNAGNAPTEYVAYRDDPASGWVPTSKNGKPPSDDGYDNAKYGKKPRATNAAGLVVSHWYVGTAATVEQIA